MKCRPAFWVIAMALVWVSSFLLTGCEQSQIRIGWIGSNVPNHISYQYTTFTGTERGTESLSAGESLTLDYQVEVELPSLWNAAASLTYT